MMECAPSEQTTVLGQGPTLRILPDDGDILDRGDVVSGIPVLFSWIGVEVRFNHVLPPR